MANNFSRRRMMQTAGLAAFAPAASAAPDNSWPPALGPGTPKICLGAPQNADEAEMRRYKQIGVDYVLMGGPRAPWDEAGLRAIMDRYKVGGHHGHQHDDRRFQRCDLGQVQRGRADRRRD